MQKPCEACGTPMEVKRSTKRFCSSSCRANVSTGNVAPIRTQRDEQSAGTGADGPIVRAARAELDAAGREDTTLGAQALSMAKLIDSGELPPATVAGLQRELRATMADALKSPTRSPIAGMRDELAARRKHA